MTSGRPAPVQLPDGGFVVPGALAGELAAALALYAGYLAGVHPPASVRARKPTLALQILQHAAQQAATRHSAAEAARGANAAVSAPEIRVLTPAQTGPLSDSTEITTAQAADILGVTAARVRQLAASGHIGGRKTGRDTWSFDPGTIRAFAARQRRTTRDAQPEDPAGAQPARDDRQRAA